MIHVLITGAHGMLGTALLSSAPTGVRVTGFDIHDGDLTEQAGADAVIAAHAGDAVIHCAAMTDVDGCTREPEKAMLVNGTATANVARACRQTGKRLVYISTDYVFAGDLGRAYVEVDEPRPLNAYGESKLAGERAAAELADHLIVRTQWLYGPAGKNFVSTIVNAAQTRPSLRVVADEWGSPTYVPDLAAGLWQLVAEPVTGIVHLTNSGVCTWHELATEALATAGLETPVEAIAAADWGSATVRPRYSPLANERWRELGHEPLRPWREAVREYVDACLA
ncbi:MAG: dTDP-4-dehydrorhamnose reductase [Armatimonadota bacterium]